MTAEQELALWFLRLNLRERAKARNALSLCELRQVAEVIDLVSMGPCANCDGAGGWDDMAFCGREWEEIWAECPQCGGTGRSPGEPQQLTMEEVCDAER
jgi:hypothetical protein